MLTRGWIVFALGLGLAACADEAGTLVTATLPPGLVEAAAGDTVAIEWFVAPLPNDVPGEAMERIHYEGDVAPEVAVSALTAGYTLRLDSALLEHAEVALVIWGQLMGLNGPQVIAFGHQTVVTGPDALRSYQLTLQSAVADEKGTLPDGCPELTAPASTPAVHVWGDKTNDDGSCLRWREDAGDGPDAYFSMVWPGDRDCDGVPVDPNLVGSCG